MLIWTDLWGLLPSLGSSLNNTYIVEQGSILKEAAKTNQILNGGDIIFIPYDLEVNRWTKFKDWMTISGQIAAFIVLIQNIVGNGIWWIILFYIHSTIYICLLKRIWTL